MGTPYVTREGDTVDLIAWNFYGSTENRVVEQVLEANAGVADLGAALPAGITITLPAIERPAQQQGVRLWD